MLHVYKLFSSKRTLQCSNKDFAPTQIVLEKYHNNFSLWAQNPLWLFQHAAACKLWLALERSTIHFRATDRFPSIPIPPAPNSYCWFVLQRPSHAFGMSGGFFICSQDWKTPSAFSGYQSISRLSSQASVDYSYLRIFLFSHLTPNCKSVRLQGNMGCNVKVMNIL